MRGAGRINPDQLLARIVPYLAVAVVIALSLALPREVSRYQAWPLLISIVFLGLPHGGGDHLVPVWAKAKRPTGVYFGCFSAGYLAVAALIWALWLVSPAAGTLYFLAITVWHWGSADASDALPHSIGSREWLIRSVCRGAIIIAGPVAAHFAAASSVIASLALAFHSGYRFFGNLKPAAEFIAGISVATELCIAAWKREPRLLAETVLLTALVVAAPPLAAVGAYFLGWHSLRHLARLTSLRASNAQWMWRQFFATYSRLIPLTIAAVALLIGMGAYLRVRLDQQSIVAVYLILISALTLPHALVTGWLDWRERINPKV